MLRLRLSRALIGVCTALGLDGFALRSARADDGVQSGATPATAPPLPRASTVDGDIEGWPADQPLPPGYRWDSRPHSTLVNIGTGLFALGYAPALAIGAIGNEDLLHPGDPLGLWLLAPLAGPFVLLGDARNDIASVLLLADGAFQAVGMGLTVVGLVWRRPVLVPTAKSAVRVAPTPLVLGKGGGGLALFGTF